MACDPIYSAFTKLTGHLSELTHRRVALRRPIVGLQKQSAGIWPDGVGDTFSNVTWARNFPLDPVASRATYAASSGTQTVSSTTGLVTLANTTTDACLPPKIVIPTGSISQSVSKNRLAIETPEFCYEDVRTSHQQVQMWNNVQKQLEDVQAHVWAEWFTSDYFNVAGHNLTAMLAGLTDNASAGYSTTVPSSKLTMGMIEEVENNIMIEGPDGVQDTNGAFFDMPVFWIVSLATYQRLLRDNSELRQDIRWAYMGARDESPLLPRHNYAREVKVLGGHNFVIDPFPRRFSNAGGGAAYVRVPHWAQSSATIGSKMAPNSAYKATGLYEETIAWVPGMYRSLAISKSMTLPDFNPTSWMGDFKALNILNKECNPDGNKVFWRGLFADGAEPLNTDLGYTILHLACGFNTTGAAC